jgi:orotate phosphoribosyltransferase
VTGGAATAGDGHADAWGDDPARVRALLTEVGALREGHFVLTSGRHSDRFFLLARLFEHPDAGGRVAAALARRVAAQPGTLPVDCVVGPAMGGIILAYEVARALGARALFAEKRDGGGMALRRGFRLAAGERVLAVEDALTTGGSVAQAIAAAEAQGAEVVAVAAVVRRGQHTPPFAQPVVALLEDDARDWPPAACPLCARGSEAVRPKA